MKQFRFILIVLFLSLSRVTLSCDCNTAGLFLQVAPKSDFVALVKVTKYLTFDELDEEETARTPMSMEVEIIEIYKGTETRKTLTVWGDNGILCRPYLSIFKPGKYYVIAFQKGRDGSKGHVHKGEKITDYAISICGEYWLKADMTKRVAKGVVTDLKKVLRLDEIKSKLVTQN